MTKNTELKALPRTETGKEANHRLRVEGRIPAVVYGKDMEAQGISLSHHDTFLLFQRISVENTIVQLSVEGESEPIPTLIREIQTYPHKDGIIHVDFLRIQKGVKVELTIPVRLEGVPAGVRESGGVLEQVINELKVKCIPSLIPEVVSLDVSGMMVGDSLHVSDVFLGEGVEILVDPSQTICNVAVPKVVVVETDEDEDAEGETAVADADDDDDASSDDEV